MQGGDPCGDLHWSRPPSGRQPQRSSSRSERPSRPVSLAIPARRVPRRRRSETVKAKAGVSCKIGLQNPFAANESLQYMQKGAVAQAKALGCKIITLDDALSVDKQVSNMQQLLAQKVNAIIFYPLDPKAVNPVLAQAKKQGVPVVAEDAGFGNPKAKGIPGVSAGVWQARDIQAFLQVQALAKAKPGAKVGPDRDRRAGSGAQVPDVARRRSTPRRPGSPSSASRTTRPTTSPAGRRPANALVQRFSDMDAVIGYNDPSAIGAVIAARSAGRKLTVVGLNGTSDGLAAVKDGRLVATVRSESVSIGQELVRGAYLLATKQKLPATVVVVRPQPRHEGEREQAAELGCPAEGDQVGAPLAGGSPGREPGALRPLPRDASPPLLRADVRRPPLPAEPSACEWLDRLRTAESSRPRELTPARARAARRRRATSMRVVSADADAALAHAGRGRRAARRPEPTARCSGSRSPSRTRSRRKGSRRSAGSLARVGHVAERDATVVRAPARGGCRHRGEDQRARVHLVVRDRQRRQRADAAPARSRTYARRVERGRGGAAGRRRVDRRDRDGRRRLDPRAVALLRHRRPATDGGTRARDGLLAVHPRHGDDRHERGRADGAIRRGSRAAAPRPRRARRGRPVRRRRRPWPTPTTRRRPASRRLLPRATASRRPMPRRRGGRRRRRRALERGRMLRSRRSCPRTSPRRRRSSSG